MARFGFGLGFRSQASTFAPIFGSESRNFTTLDSSGSKHYTIPSISSFAGSLIIDADFAMSGTPSNEPVFQFGQALCRIKSDTEIEVWGDIAASGTTFTVPSLGNKLHTLSLALIAGSSSFTLTLDGVSEGTQSSTLVVDLSGSTYSIGSWQGGNADGIITNVKITDAGALKRFYKIDETWDGPSTVLVDSGSDGSNGTAVNITTADSENFNFDGSVSPNTWTNDAETIVIEVAGT